MRSHHRDQPGSARVIHEVSAIGRALLLFIQLFNFSGPSRCGHMVFSSSGPGLDNPYISVSHQVNACDPAKNSEKRQGDREVMKWPHGTWLILAHNIHIYHNHTELCPEGHSPTVLNPLRSGVLEQNTERLDTHSLLLFPSAISQTGVWDYPFENFISRK